MEVGISITWNSYNYGVSHNSWFFSMKRQPKIYRNGASFWVCILGLTLLLGIEWK